MYEYQRYNQYSYPQYQQPKMIAGDELKFVNGIESARQYQLYPNSKAILMDANEDKFYLVESDASGISTIKTYRFELEPEPAPIDLNNYITRQELEEVLKKYELTSKQSKSTDAAKSTASKQF